MNYPDIYWQIHKTALRWMAMLRDISKCCNQEPSGNIVWIEILFHTTPKTNQALTYSQLLSEDGAFTQRRAVPAAVSELVLAFVDAQLCPLSNHDDGVRPALADGALAGCETGDLIADDVRTKGHHRGKSPVGQKRQTQLIKWTLLAS